MKNFVFFGDSIFVGQYISIEKTFVSKTANFFSKTNNSLIFHNRSVNGCTTRQALERMDFDIFGLNPDIVNIQFGINDCNIWETDFGHPRVSKQSYIENIKEMIDRCLYKKVKYIIINSNHPLNRHKNLPNSRLSYEQMNTQYSSELTKIFKNYSKKVLFFDIRKEIIKSYHLSQKKYEYLIDDGVHLSQKGHDFYFEKFNKFLLNKLNF